MLNNMSSMTREEAVSQISRALTALQQETYRSNRWKAIHAARSLTPPMTWEEIGNGLGVMPTAAARFYRQDAPKAQN